MNQITTKYQLSQALFTGGALTVVKEGQVITLNPVNRVEREDGSGKCFNVTGHQGEAVVTVFVRTID